MQKTCGQEWHSIPLRFTSNDSSSLRLKWTNERGCRIATGHLSAAELRPEWSADQLGFATTAELGPLAGLLGQERALKSLEFGAAIRHPDFNLFVLGSSETGRHGMVQHYLSERARYEQVPDDWVYVNNFENPRKPKALCLPHGRGIELRDGMRELVRDLSLAIPGLFESEDYKAHRRTIDDEFEAAQEKKFEELQRRAEAENFSLLRTPMGFALTPLRDGKVIKADLFSALPQHEREEIETKMAELQEQLKLLHSRRNGVYIFVNSQANSRKRQSNRPLER